jgi:hypothetical protein
MILCDLKYSPSLTRWVHGSVLRLAREAGNGFSNFGLHWDGGGRRRLCVSVVGLPNFLHVHIPNPAQLESRRRTPGLGTERRMASGEESPGCSRLAV